MARLISRLVVLFALGLASTAAVAEPITLAIGAWFATASAITIATVALTVLSTAYSVYGAVQAKKKARAAAKRTAEQEAANLKDRTATLLTSDSPWVMICGSPSPVGGSIVAVLTSGDRDQYKHVVFILAAHECDGVEAIYMGGDWIGNLDSDGYADGAEFQLTEGVPRLVTREFELQEVSYETENGSITYPDGYWSLQLPIDAEGFNLVSILDEAGNPYGSIVQLGDMPQGLRNRALVGPIGAKGTVSYWINGAGAALNVQVHLSPGGVDTADLFLRAARPDLWTADHKLSGYTYLVVSMNLLLDRFQGGVPEITVKLRGKKVLDVRTGLTVYSRNPALCLADFLRSEAGYGASLDQIELDSLIAAANACDVAVYDQAAVDADPATYGGSRARYTCDGMFRSDQDRDATRQQFEDAMVGFSLESGGVWRIQAGAWSTPVLALTDDDMVMPMNIVQGSNVGTARYNGAKGTYANAARNGVTEDFAPYINLIFRAQDVKDKILDTTLSFTGNHVRTQQISRVLVEQSRGGFVVQIFPKMFAWNVQPGDRIVLSSRLYEFTNKRFRVQDWTYQQGTPVALQCVEDEEAFYDQADEVRADAAPNTSLPSPFLKPGQPLDLVVLSGEAQMVQQDGVMVVRAKVQWAQSTDPAVLRSGVVRVQYRLADDGEPWQTIDLPGESTEVYLLGLAVNNVYVVRVQFQTPYAVSAWSAVQHELHGLEGPPDSVLGLDVRAELTGIFAYWDEPAGIDLLGWNTTQIRRGPSWELAESAILFDGRAKSANLGWFPVGSQAVWAAHHNTIGDWSAPVFHVIEILAPAQPLPTAKVNNRNQVSIVWLDCKTTQPIDFYEIRHGDTADTAEVLAQARGTSFETVQPNFGAHRYWVIAVDLAGNRGARGYCTALTLQSLDSEIANTRPVIAEALDLVGSIQIKAQIQAAGALATARNKLKSDTLKVAATVEQNRIEAISADQALASQITTVTAEFNGSIAQVTDALQSVATAQAATASRVVEVVAEFNGNIAVVTDRIESVATAQEATASQLTTVTAEIGGSLAFLTSSLEATTTAQQATADLLTVLSSTVGTNQATAVAQYATLADTDQALATQLNALATTVGDNQALFSDQITTLSDQQGAMASQITILGALAGDNAAGIVNEGNVRADADSALAGQISTVQANLNGLSATVQTTSNTLADFSGNVAAQWMVRTEVVGSTGLRGIAGISTGVSSSSGGGAPQSEIVLFADRTLIASGPGSASMALPMLRAEGGTVYIEIANIKNADIGTLKVAGDALSTAVGASGIGSVPVSFTVPAGQVWRAISTGVIGKGPNSVGTRYSQNLALTGATTYVVPSVDIDQSDTESGTVYTYAGVNATIAGIQEFGAGTHTVTCDTTDATTGAAVATPITLIVNLQKRGA